jgi:hypothetical protein
VAAPGRDDINPASVMTAGATVAIGVVLVIGKTITAMMPAGIATTAHVLATPPAPIYRDQFSGTPGFQKGLVGNSQKWSLR